MFFRIYLSLHTFIFFCLPTYSHLDSSSLHLHGEYKNCVKDARIPISLQDLKTYPRTGGKSTPEKP
jgi:hypothetical protein